MNKNLLAKSIIISSFWAVFFLISSSNTYAQVSAVKDLAKSAGGSSDSFSGGSDVGFYFFADLADLMIYGLIDGQRNLIERKSEEPWLFSADVNLHGGYYGKETATILSPSIRGNFGVISSTIRYNKFQDFTGAFPTWDWQVIQFNIVSQPGVNFRIGSGFMHEIENDDSFYEQYFGLELFFNQRKVSPKIELRWAEDFETDRTARFEINTKLDVFLARYGKINVHAMAGFLYQKYYEQVNFYFAQTGLTFSFY